MPANFNWSGENTYQLGRSAGISEQEVKDTIANEVQGKATDEQKGYIDKWSKDKAMNGRIYNQAINRYKKYWEENYTPEGFAMGGYVESYEEGGEVEGEGTGTSDSIDAKLSDGEFVFTAKAVEVIGADNLQKIMEEAERQYDERTSLSKARSMFGKFLKG